MCANIYQSKFEKTGPIYCTCMIKPKHVKHPEMPAFGNVHLLLVETFMQLQTSQRSIYETIYQ